MDHKELVDAIVEFSTTYSPDAPDYPAWQQEMLRHVDLDIKGGCKGMRVCKALLESCGNWATCEITDLDRFKRLLLLAIDNGALSPDDFEGWYWIDIAVANNDPAEFMDDTLRFAELLADAGEHGISSAFDIMDMIWEPENCQEED